MLTIAGLVVMISQVYAFVRCGCPVGPPGGVESFHSMGVWPSATVYTGSDTVDWEDCRSQTNALDTSTNHIRVDCNVMDLYITHHAFSMNS
ncbi:hypothetical protein E5Q_02293 [Mixia osmundae IAM 14324]|uniref:Uncharacterized protein n=1 Tax=Mixia osmundae (strain CBS 9802 / IAM 14324 / JCM 22182 / KY 12970) TaxID=764103 RepID=G7DYH7_MIXOS|nr:hypothetical protein E5Q_02293 [Mixia osmundae IAM 14324]